ncbi:NAD(P)-dependent oxidoreductase [Metapseudomonas resinovorans]|uniref:Putative beta-hydroxyacid dehydrogenase n=1 Tax=Metapseudomonas resinovorans NBRC 106553 TaxID=1245471 RepID=S6AIW7_METRE|nr:NAD(P)-dependent oxidoreductase [Pseudomonas resinovorans]BAN48385.1 putative beta-hydroxyacid dehydrogenase [Pseudomonas resinovorans NBRC 106553]
MSESIGFIGLGAMGQRMARHLLDHGFGLELHDPDPRALAPLLARGARSHASPKAVADATAIVLVCVPTPEIVEQVVLGDSGVIHGQAVRVLVDHSTTGPSVARRLDQALAAQGIATLDAPLAGGVAGAEAGTLSVMVGGPADAYARCEPVFAAFGRKVVHLGDAAGLGQTLKLVNNMIVGATLVTTSEALLFGIKAGLDPAQMLDILNAGTARSYTSEQMLAGTVLRREFDFGFRLDLMRKDLRLFLAEAETTGVPALACAVVKQMFDQAVNSGEPTRDMTHVVQVLEGLAGVRIQ